MNKRKMVQSSLLKNSIAAYFAAIEIHNKPNISYRYEAVTLLMMNAWELLLKAFIKKYAKKRNIFEKGSKHTISFEKAISYTDEQINISAPKEFSATKENLIFLEEYRNNIVHFYNEQLEPYIFMLVSKAALNYVDFVKKYFSKDVMEVENLFIMPLGFKLPFKPEDFLSKNSAKYVSSSEAKEFISNMVKVISYLDSIGVQDSIVVGFDVYLDNVKKMKNRDLLCAITEIDEADVTLAKIKRIQIVDDVSAQKVFLSEDEIMNRYPLTYKDVCDKCRSQIPGFKLNHNFHKFIASIKSNPEYCYTRKLNPKNISTSKTTFYSDSIIEMIMKNYDR